MTQLSHAKKIKFDLKVLFPNASNHKLSEMFRDVCAGRLQLINSWESFENYLDIKRNNALTPYVVARNEIATVSFDTRQVSTENSNIFTQSVPADAANFKICPFSTISGRNWMAEKTIASNQSPMVFPVMLLGSGPFEIAELARFLNHYRMNVYLEEKELEDPDFENITQDSSERPFKDWDFYCNMHAPVIVCGQYDFKTSGFLSLLSDNNIAEKPSFQLPPQMVDILRWIERVKVEQSKSFYFKRSKSLANLNFISQEMLLASIFTDQHPRVPYGSDWQEHIKTHNALSFIEQQRANKNIEDKNFVWPTTEITSGNGTLADQFWPQIGMLKFLGYNVGHKGALRTDRQKALQIAFTMHELPKVNGPEYVKGWGNASTGLRLKKIADSIATFCRNARHQNSTSYTATIADYEEDLAWLKKTYYDGRFDRQFTWPDTKQ